MHALSLVRGFFLVATPIIFTLTSLTAHAQTDDLPNIGLAPHSAGGYAPDAVIVKFRPSANASNKARARGLVNAVSNRQFKIVIFTPSWLRGGSSHVLESQHNQYGRYLLRCFVS